VVVVLLQRHLHELHLARPDLWLRLHLGEGLRHGADGAAQQAAVGAPHLPPEGRLHVLQHAAER